MGTKKYRMLVVLLILIFFSACIAANNSIDSSFEIDKDGKLKINTNISGDDPKFVSNEYTKTLLFLAFIAAIIVFKTNITKNLHNLRKVLAKRSKKIFKHRKSKR